MALAVTHEVVDQVLAVVDDLRDLRSREHLGAHDVAVGGEGGLLGIESAGGALESISRAGYATPVPYPTATTDDIAFFAEHGWIAVTDAIDPADLATLEARCEVILEKKERMAFDWAWEEGTPHDERTFRILQSSPTLFFPEINDERFRAWAVEFASALMRRPLEFWYDQFLAKPPGTSVPTRWHQDEGYWGRNLEERGITCWMPMHDVDETNGCMHFIDGGHKDGVIEHKLVPGVQSDLL